MQGKQSQNTMDPVETSVSNRETHIVDGSANAELDRQRNMLAYVKTSIPIRIFQCMQRLNILKCMKIFILQRMERTTINTGNVTADFLDQILSNGPNGDGDASYDDILDKYYLQMSDPELNDRLQKSFQRFFHDREIKLHFIPGMVVKVVPNAENAINLSLKRGKPNDSQCCQATFIVVNKHFNDGLRNGFYCCVFFLVKGTPDWRRTDAPRIGRATIWFN